MKNHLSPLELAARWGCHHLTLSKKRTNGTGIPYVKLNGRIWYPLEVVEAEEQRLVRSTAESQVVKIDPGMTQPKNAFSKNRLK